MFKCAATSSWGALFIQDASDRSAYSGLAKTSRKRSVRRAGTERQAGRADSERGPKRARDDVEIGMRRGADGLDPRFFTRRSADGASVLGRHRRVVGRDMRHRFLGKRSGFQRLRRLTSRNAGHRVTGIVFAGHVVTSFWRIAVTDVRGHANNDNPNPRRGMPAIELIGDLRARVPAKQYGQCQYCDGSLGAYSSLMTVESTPAAGA
jgi:hypothetical protein